MRIIDRLRPLAGVAAIATAASLVACGINRNGGDAHPSSSGSVPSTASPTSTSPAPLSPSPTSSVAVPSPSSSPSVSPSSEVQAWPGVPATPVAAHEAWPAVEGRNRDRQLDYKGSGDPAVRLPAALGDDLSAYAGQEITWQACGEGIECATMKVPLDWENRAGRRWTSH